MKGLLAFTFFLPALLCADTIFAQDSTSHFSIVLSPALFIPVSAAVQGGIQYRVDRKFAIVIEAATPTFHPNNTTYEKIEYWRAGIEIKYRLNLKNNVNKYLSIQDNYLFRQLTDKDQAFYYTRKQTFSYQGAVIKSPVLSSALKLGIEVPAGKKVFFDLFVGFGLRFIFTKYSSDKVLVTSTEPPKQNLLDFDDAWLYNYTLMRFHATAGLRFGLRL